MVMRFFSAKSFTLAVLIAATITSPRVIAQAQQNRDEDIEGILEVQVEDSRGGSVQHHFLDTGTEKLKLRGRPDNSEFLGLTTGTKVRVHGHRSDNNSLDLSSTGGGSSVTTLALASPNTFGAQRTVVLMVNFQDNAATPYGWTDAADVVFNQVNQFYRENSYNQTSIYGDVFGWFTLPMSSSVCDTTQIQTLADQAATAAGVNLNNYPRRLYAFPNNACGFWGRGTVGGNPSLAWINGAFSLKVVAHEMGHNFGLYHSNSMTCDSGVCTANEYGDDRDMMGQYGIGDFQSYQKERLGWLNYGSSPTVQTISASGTYFVSSLQIGGAPSALKILKASTTSDRTYYYIENREQTSYDSAPGVVLHTGNSANGDSAYEVDLDPATSAFDTTLDVNQLFSDPAANFSVSTISSDASGAWVTITYTGAPCAASAPTVTLSPGSAITSPSNQSAYTMTVKNNDGAGCSSAGFGVGMTVPSGWTWSAAQSSISIAPGSTAGTTVYVTPSAQAAGASTVQALANRTGSGPSGQASATLTVANGINVSLRTTGGSNYQIVVTVTAGGAPFGGANLSVTVTDPKGGVNTYSATSNSSGTATIKGKLKGKDPHGTYQVLVRATAGNLTGSAAGSFVY